jgi:hypothetical protein
LVVEEGGNFLLKGGAFFPLGDGVGVDVEVGGDGLGGVALKEETGGEELTRGEGGCLGSGRCVRMTLGFDL